MPNPVFLFAATRWEASPQLYQLPNTSLTITGIGMKKAERVARKTANDQSPLLVSIGFSGATHESLRPFDIVLANQVYQINNRKGWHTEKEISFPEINLVSYHDTCFENSRVVWGTIGCVRHPLWTPGSKMEAGTSRAVCAVDMESAAIAETAKDSRLSFLAIRIILDSVREPLWSWTPWKFRKRVFRARELLGKFVSHYFNGSRTTNDEPRTANK